MTNAMTRRPPGDMAKANPIQALAEYQHQNCNVLLPVTQIDRIPVGTMLSVREVRIDQQADTYPVDRGGRALLGHALDRLASAAGITWDAIQRTDDRRHPHFCEFRAVARATMFDGTVRLQEATKTIDLREEAGQGEMGPRLKQILSTAEGKGRDPSKQILQEREFIAEYCASKAKNRAIRQLLSLRSKYQPAELSKPFIVPKLVPDTSNPMAQQLVLANMMGATQALFGGAGVQGLAPRPPEPVPMIERAHEEPASQGSGDNGGPAPEPAPSTPSVGDLWRRAQTLGIDGAAFASMCYDTTGKNHSKDLSETDCGKVQKALDKFESVAHHTDGGVDGVPF